MALHAPAALPAQLPVGHKEKHLRAELKAPRLSVVVVNYRQWDKTHELVRQLQASEAMRTGDAEVIIVDNHSPADPLAGKLRRLPGVSLRRWDRNQGFARAVNEGCRLSRGDWFLLLNPDTTLSEGFLDGVLALANQLEANDPRAGIVGFHLRNSDGARQLSTGRFPSLVSTLLRLALPRSRRKYQVQRTPERCPVSWVTGCCLLLRRACLQDLNGLDEEYFLYYEDVDLCLRAGERGWSVWYDPNLVVIHHHPLHSRAVPAALRLVTRHSLLTYCAKHWPGWQFRLLARLIRAEALLRSVRAWARGDRQQLGYFRELGALSRDMMKEDAYQARQRVNRAVRRIDVRVGVQISSMAGTIILVLKIAVIAVTVLFGASLVALAKGNYRLHGRINTVFFVLTFLAVVGLEVVARVLSPTLFAEHFEAHQAQSNLRVHLSFSMPAALLLPFMLVTGLRRRRAWHVSLGAVFFVLWTGAFITGVFFLPHEQAPKVSSH